MYMYFGDPLPYLVSMKVVSHSHTQTPPSSRARERVWSISYLIMLIQQSCDLILLLAPSNKGVSLICIRWKWSRASGAHDQEIWTNVPRPLPLQRVGSGDKTMKGVVLFPDPILYKRKGLVTLVHNILDCVDSAVRWPDPHTGDISRGFYDYRFFVDNIYTQVGNRINF